MREAEETHPPKHGGFIEFRLQHRRLCTCSVISCQHEHCLSGHRSVSAAKNRRRCYFYWPSAHLISGIQIFMYFYGLSIFLETPKAQRAGRTPYIVVSFTILLLSTLSASLDAYVTFRMGWESTSGRDSYRVTAELEASWQRVLSLSVLFAYMCIGDGLLVRIFPECISLRSGTDTSSSALSLLCHLERQTLVQRPAWIDLSCFGW